MPRLVAALVTLFLIATVSIPVAVVNKLIFAVLLLLAFVRFVASPSTSPLRTASPLIIMAVFGYGLVLSLVGYADMPLARQLMFSVSLLLLIYPILWWRVDMDRAVKVTGVTLAALTFVYLGAVVTAGFSPLSARALDFFMQYSLSSAHERDVLGDPVFMVRLGSSPFLLLPFALLLHDLRERWNVRTLLALLLVIAAIVASTSRGLILICAVAAVVVIADRMSNTRRAAWLLVAAPLGVTALALLASRTTAFSAAEWSNAVKLGHAASFVENLTVTHALFGEGLAAKYYTSFLGRQVPQTEITLLDMLRYFGFVLTPIMFAALCLPAWRLARYIGDRTRVMGVALFVLYLVLSLTNPVLFNSMGLSVVVWYWWRVLRADDASLPATRAA